MWKPQKSELSNEFRKLLNGVGEWGRARKTRSPFDFLGPFVWSVSIHAEENEIKIEKKGINDREKSRSVGVFETPRVAPVKFLTRSCFPIRSRISFLLVYTYIHIRDYSWSPKLVFPVPINGRWARMFFGTFLVRRKKEIEGVLLFTTRGIYRQTLNSRKVEGNVVRGFPRCLLCQTHAYVHVYV